MPTKTALDTGISRIKPAKKPAAKKTAVTKKNVATVKTEALVKPTAKTVKKVSSKKTVAKKAVSKSRTLTAVEVESEPSVLVSAPSVAFVETQVYQENKPLEIHRKFILVGVCRNCEHMPMGINKLVAMLSIVIAILSGLLIYTSSPVSLNLPTISMSSITDWITPTSYVKNL